jgi:HEPN domain-containing protein
MPVPRDWADAFLEQAREDLRAAEAAYTASCESTFCMLLQMAYEKLAKAAFARRGLQPTRTHDGASRLLLLLGKDPAGPMLPGYQGRVLEAVRELENAQPAIVSYAMRMFGVPQYPQLEYPWENPSSGAIEWPGQHLPVAQRVRDPRQRIGADLLKFAHAINVQFNALFP